MTKKTAKKQSSGNPSLASSSTKANRRRKIDPTTCERDYSCEEREFMKALDEYKRNQGRMFPTCSEILEVIRDLGYVQQDDGSQVERVVIDRMVKEADMSCTSL